MTWIIKSFLEECIIHMKVKLDIKYIVKINNGVRFGQKRTTPIEKGERKMSSYIIEGGKKLEGETYVSGSKNASLPIMAATILNKGVSKLYNVPKIHDTQMMIEILKRLGCKVKCNKNKVVIDSSNVNSFEIPEGLMREMRSSVIFAGSIVGRYKKAIFSYPGDCDIWLIHRTNIR